MKYCKDLLTNCPPTEEYREDLETKKLLQLERMKRNDDKEEAKLSRNKFEATWKDLETNKREKYKFIFNGGESIKEALFTLFSRVWETEDIPSLWNKIQLVQIYKSGPPNELTSYRNIHLKSESVKMFGHLVMSDAKKNLNENTNDIQTAKPSHRPEENLYV